MTTGKLDQLEALTPSEFTPVLKTAVSKQQMTVLEPFLLQRLAAETLQPMDFYQVLLALPTTAENIQFKLQLWQAIAAKPITLQIINLLRDNWKPGTQVEFREQGEMNAWSALCVVTHAGVEQCQPCWSSARAKATARIAAAHQWLESWLWEELISPEQAQLPELDSTETTQPTINHQIQTLPEAPLEDYVTRLNLYAQRHGSQAPEYAFAESQQPGLFKCQCHFLAFSSTGEGGSKKKAKNAAAEKLWVQVAKSTHDVRVFSR